MSAREDVIRAVEQARGNAADNLHREQACGVCGAEPTPDEIAAWLDDLDREDEDDEWTGAYSGPGNDVEGY